MSKGAPSQRFRLLRELEAFYGNWFSILAIPAILAILAI
jgi:hypothetical protein